MGLSFGILKRKVGGKELEVALTEARAAVTAAEEKLAKAKSDYAANILCDDLDEALKAREAISFAEVERDRSIAFRSALEQQLAQAQARLEEERRIALCAAAEEANRAAEKALRSYPTLAQKIVGVIKAVAEADEAVAAANASLPAGKAPVAFVEHTVRGLPREHDRIVEVIDTEVWCYENGVPVEPERINAIESADGRRGRLLTTAGDRRGPGLYFDVTKRIDRRKKTIRGRPEFRSEPLALQIALPGLLPGSADFWTPCGPGIYGDPGSTGILSIVQLVQGSWNAPPVDPRPENIPTPSREIVDLEDAQETVH